MKISILTPDLSSNCLGRAYILAKILQRNYEVDIVGPVFGDGIWKPVANDKSITYKSVKICGRFKPYWQIRDLAKKIDGDVVYASKPLFTSFGLGLLKKVVDKKPLILDIDDWQMGFIKESYTRLSFYRRFRFLASSTLYFYNTGSYWNNLLSEKLNKFADEIIVSNNFLKEKFGGTIIWHARDTNVFNPENFDRNLIKEKYKIKGSEKIVMFFGTSQPYKGIEDAIKAIYLIKDPNIVLAIVGLDKKHQYCRNLIKIGRKLLKNRIKLFEFQCFEKIPYFLTIADIIVVPQRRNSATIGQIPAKVFDAMAMAKPIIATNVSDLPEILEGCGWIVEPENPEKLAEAIQNVLSNPNEAEIMGQKARQKCIEKYSWDAMENILLKVFKKYE